MRHQLKYKLVLPSACASGTVVAHDLTIVGLLSFWIRADPFIYRRGFWARRRGGDHTRTGILFLLRLTSLQSITDSPTAEWFAGMGAPDSHHDNESSWCIFAFFLKETQSINIAGANAGRHRHVFASQKYLDALRLY